MAGKSGRVSTGEQDWDLSRHSQYSGQDLSYTDPETKERYIPWIVETSGGVDRTFLNLLLDAYEEEPPTGKDKEGRTVIAFASLASARQGGRSAFAEE